MGSLVNEKLANHQYKGSFRNSGWWLGAIAVLLAALFIAFGTTGYGPLHVDSNYLTLPAVAWASGQGFVNPIWPTAEALDPLGIGRFLYHGPAFQILLRTLLHPATGAQALLVIQWINALSIILFAWFLSRVDRAYPGAARTEVRIAKTVILLSFAAILMAATGRPETLAIPLVLVGAHVLLSFRTQSSPHISQTVPVGAILGLLAVTHPLNAVEGGLVLTIWYGLRKTPMTALIHSAATGAVAMIVALVFMAIVFPFPVSDWIAGMRAHTAIAVAFVDLRVVRFFVLDTGHPAYGLTLLAAIVGCLVWWWRHRKSVSSPWIVSIAGFLLLAIVARVSLFVAFRAYDSYPMFSLLGAGLMVASSRVRLRWVRMVIVAVLALPGIGFVRLALLFPFYVTSGMSLVEARGEFEQMLAEEQRAVGVTSNLWLLTENYESLRINFWLVNNDDRTGQPLDVVVVQQSHHASIDSLAGYQKVRSYRRNGIPRFLGIPLARSIPGYQFDVYHRIEVPPAGSSEGMLNQR